MKSRRNLFWLLLLLLLDSNTVAQEKFTLQDFLKIKPLVSSRDDVKKIYGIGTIYNNKHIADYETDFGFATVSYSMGDCQNAKVKLWNVPEWTVEEIIYDTEDTKIGLKDLLKDIKPYKRKQKGDVLDHIYYFNEEKGIAIIYDINLKEVIKIIITPTKSQTKEFSCEEIQKRSQEDTVNNFDSVKQTPPAAELFDKLAVVMNSSSRRRLMTLYCGVDFHSRRQTVCYSNSDDGETIATARKLLIRSFIMLRDEIDYAEFRRRGIEARSARVTPFQGTETERNEFLSRQRQLNIIYANVYSVVADATKIINLIPCLERASDR